MVLEKTIKLFRSKGNKWRPGSTSVQALQVNDPSDVPEGTTPRARIKIKIKKSSKSSHSVPRIPISAWGGGNLEDGETEDPDQTNNNGHQVPNGYTDAVTPREGDDQINHSQYPVNGEIDNLMSTANNLDLLKFLVSNETTGKSIAAVASSVTSKDQSGQTGRSDSKCQNSARGARQVTASNKHSDKAKPGFNVNNEDDELEASQEEPISWLSSIETKEKKSRSVPEGSVSPGRSTNTIGPCPTQRDCQTGDVCQNGGNRKATSPDKSGKLDTPRQTAIQTNRVNKIGMTERSLMRIKSPERSTTDGKLSRLKSPERETAEGQRKTLKSPERKSTDAKFSRLKSPERCMQERQYQDSSNEQNMLSAVCERVLAPLKETVDSPRDHRETKSGCQTHRSLSFSASQHRHKPVQRPVMRSNTLRQSDPEGKMSGQVENRILAQSLDSSTLRQMSAGYADECSPMSLYNDLHKTNGYYPNSPRNGMKINMTKITTLTRPGGVDNQKNPVKVRTFMHINGPHVQHQQQLRPNQGGISLHTSMSENSTNGNNESTNCHKPGTSSRAVLHTPVHGRKKKIKSNKYVLRGIDNQMEKIRIYRRTSSVHFTLPEAKDSHMKGGELASSQVVEPGTAVEQFLETSQITQNTTNNKGNAIVFVHGETENDSENKPGSEGISTEHQDKEKESLQQTGTDCKVDENKIYTKKTETNTNRDRSQDHTYKEDKVRTNESGLEQTKQEHKSQQNVDCTGAVSKKFKAQMKTASRSAEAKPANDQNPFSVIKKHTDPKQTETKDEKSLEQMKPDESQGKTTTNITDFSEKVLAERFRVGSAPPRRSITFNLVTKSGETSHKHDAVGHSGTTEQDVKERENGGTSASSKNSKRIIIIEKQPIPSDVQTANTADIDEGVVNNEKNIDSSETIENVSHKHKQRHKKRERKESEQQCTDTTQEDDMKMIESDMNQSLEQSHRRSRRRKKDQDCVDIMLDKRIQVDPTKIVNYLKLVKENEKEYMALRGMGSAGNDKPCRSMIGIAKAYRRGHHENLESSESIVVQAAYELGNKTSHPISLKYEKMERKRAELIARASLVMHKQMQKRHRTDPHEMMDQDSLALPDELTFTPLERARAELEIWIKGLSAAQQIKAKELAIKLMGEEDKSMRKWWVSQKYCKYLRQRHRPQTLSETI